MDPVTTLSAGLHGRLIDQGSPEWGGPFTADGEVAPVGGAASRTR